MTAALGDSCGRCGARLLAELEGLCARCLSAALEQVEAFAEEPVLGEDGKPRRAGKYELVEQIGRGGMGVVFRAWDPELGRFVALKMIAEAELDTEVQVHALKAEARIAASLDHPHIVPVYEVGKHEERYYFAMKLMERGSLEDAREHYQGLPPRKVAELVETIARAVYSGHQHGILHRDLKPSNVLLDADEVPHVADFGIARALDTEAGGTQLDRAGTLEYMAPEQAFPSGKPLTVAADVYSLGVILYELLTGQRPFKADSEDALLEQVLSAPPQPPRELKRHIPRDLEAICLRCLEKEPTRRYRSAAELADELKRYRRFEPVLARPRRMSWRAWLGCLRYPLAAATLATLLVGLLLGWHFERDQEDELRGGALGFNVYAARYAAGAVLSQLLLYSHDVEHAAQERALVDALQAGDVTALQSFCRERFKYDEGPRAGSGFSGVCFILDTTGRIVACWPPEVAPAIVGNDYHWRDYFQGAERLATQHKRATYVSRAYKAEADHLYAFALAAPVYAADDTWAGVLALSVRTNSTLGALRFNDPSYANRTATLVGLADRMRGQPEPPGKDVYAVIAHDQLRRGMPATLGLNTARQLARALPEPAPHGEPQLEVTDTGGQVLAGYQDPVSDEPGTWLAAFAPVGRTGFAVIVQSRENVVLQANEHLTRRPPWWLVSFSVSVGLLWLVLRWLRYRLSGYVRRAKSL